MTLLARLCIRAGHFPRRRWFYNVVMDKMWTPIEDARNPEVVGGIFSFGQGYLMTPRKVAEFKRWWADMQ
jgi:hypothetical protein